MGRSARVRYVVVVRDLKRGGVIVGVAGPWRKRHLADQEKDRWNNDCRPFVASVYPLDNGPKLRRLTTET